MKRALPESSFALIRYFRKRRRALPDRARFSEVVSERERTARLFSRDFNHVKAILMSFFLHDLSQYGWQWSNCTYEQAIFEAFGDALHAYANPPQRILRAMIVVEHGDTSSTMASDSC